MDPATATLFLPYALSVAATTLQGSISAYRQEQQGADHAADQQRFVYDKDHWNRVADCQELFNIIEPSVSRLLQLPVEAIPGVPNAKEHVQALQAFVDSIAKFIHRSQAFVTALSSAARGPNTVTGPMAWTTSVSVAFEHGITLIQQYAIIRQIVTTLSNLDDAYDEVKFRFEPIGQSKILLRSAISDVYLSVHNHLPNAGPTEYAVGTTLAVAGGIIGGSAYAGYRYFWSAREAELRVKPYANAKQEVKLVPGVTATPDGVAEKGVLQPKSAAVPSYDSSIVFTQADGRSRLPVELRIIHADPRYRGIPGHSRPLRFNDRIILVGGNRAMLGRKKSGSSWVATFDPVGEIDCTWVVCRTF